MKSGMKLNGSYTSAMSFQLNLEVFDEKEGWRRREREEKVEGTTMISPQMIVMIRAVSKNNDLLGR